MSIIIFNNSLGDFRNDTAGYQRIVSVFLSLVFLVNFALVIGNLIPSNSDFVKSDGFHLLRIIKNDPYISRDISLGILSNYVYKGVESKNWDLEIIKTANLFEKSSNFVFAKYFLYAFLLDSGNIEEAGTALDEVIANINCVASENRTNLWLERAYFLFLHRSSMEEAQHCLEQVPPDAAWPMLQLRAEAAVAFSKQNWQEAKDKAHAALEDFKLRGEPIEAREEAEQIRDLLSRAETNLKMYA